MSKWPVPFLLCFVPINLSLRNLALIINVWQLFHSYQCAEGGGGGEEVGGRGAEGGFIAIISFLSLHSRCVLIFIVKRHNPVSLWKSKVARQSIFILVLLLIITN